MYDAGYNPEAIVSFFRKLQQQGGKSSGPGFLNSHPDPGDRAKNISSILARFPTQEYPQTESADYLAAKKDLANVKAESPQQAELQAGPAEATRLSVQNISSGRYTQFQHAAYVIDYPDNWKVSGNADAAVTFYPEGGLAGSAVAYGAIVSGFQPKSKSNELNAAVQELIRDIKASNPNLSEYSSPKNFILLGQNAVKLDWMGISAVRQEGKAMSERVRLVAVQGRARLVLYMIFVAPDADFQGLEPVFDHMMASLQVR
jgi:beta-barrel assembly-enhancing protease